MPTEILLNADDLSDRLNVKKDRIYELVARRAIPFCKVGRQLRFIPSQIEDWLRAGGSR